MDCNQCCLLPILYFFYPETAKRSFEDTVAYYRFNPPLIVTNDPNAISRKRPAKYIIRETEIMEKTAASKGYPSDGTVIHIERTSREGSDSAGSVSMPSHLYTVICIFWQLIIQFNCFGRTSS